MALQKVADSIFPSRSGAATLRVNPVGRERSGGKSGEFAVQTAQPRDVGALAFVIGLFLILLIVTAVLPGIR
jgi:hypothetical protein